MEQAISKLTLNDFASFLRSKNPDERYDYYDGDRCAITQVLRFLGFGVRHVDASNWSGGMRHGSLPNHWNDIASEHNTFGGALIDCEQRIARQNAVVNDLLKKATETVRETELIPA